MTRPRLPLDILAALILGAALGLLYAWTLAPVQVVDSAPEALRADFKNQYRAAIAASYASNHDLPRAKARLALLGDADSYAALSAQAQQMLAAGEPFASVEQVADLASALRNPAPTLFAGAPSATPISFQPGGATPNATAAAQETLPPFATEIPLPLFTVTPRPTRTPIPPAGAPFTLVSQESLCDESLPDGILQVVTISVDGRQLPGIELIISWTGGEEHFFTGFKPELGNGYADFSMAPNVIYNLRAADGGALIENLSAPNCTAANGESFFGGLHVVLKR